MTTTPKTPGEKKVARQQHKKLLDEARRFGVGNVVTALVADELTKKLPTLAGVEKLSKGALEAAVADGFERAWSAFEAATTKAGE